MQRFLEKYRLAGAERARLSPYKPHSRQAYRRAMWSAMATARKVQREAPHLTELVAMWAGRALAYRQLAHVSEDHADMPGDRVILGGVLAEPLTAGQLGVGRYHDGKGV